MAGAILRHHFSDRFEAYSAGTEATSVNKDATSALEERGIDTTGLMSKSVDEFIELDIDEVITVCDNTKEACPFFPGAKKYTHKGFVDPPELVKNGMSTEEAFSKVRDEIEEWIMVHFS
jgi:arsenate reductase (thioredoxin)